MPEVDNATPFGACAIPSCDRDGRDILLVVVAAHFEMPGPGNRTDRLRLLPQQDPPPIADEYVGEPGRSSIHREGQSAYTRPATDIYVSGTAFAPHGTPVTQMNVGVRVGPCAIELSVSGDRIWQRALTYGVTPSSAKPFVKMPLVWERAFGGTATGSAEHQSAFDSRNPVGCGYETDPTAAIGKPLPNIEDPGQRLRQLSDRPRPTGVAPVARYWQPRASYSGTYDETWKRERAPHWPLDFDERFFCAAVSELQASPHLAGGETVHLDGLHPDGAITFALPALRMVARSRFVDRTVRTVPILDGVLIETDTASLTLYYRAAVPMPSSFLKHRETLLRLVGPWEVFGAQ